MSDVSTVVSRSCWFFGFLWRVWGSVWVSLWVSFRPCWVPWLVLGSLLELISTWVFKVSCWLLGVWLFSKLIVYLTDSWLLWFTCDLSLSFEATVFPTKLNEYFKLSKSLISWSYILLHYNRQTFSFFLSYFLFFLIVMFLDFLNIHLE